MFQSWSHTWTGEQLPFQKAVTEAVSPARSCAVWGCRDEDTCGGDDAALIPHLQQQTRQVLMEAAGWCPGNKCFVPSSGTDRVTCFAFLQRCLWKESIFLLKHWAHERRNPTERLPECSELRVTTLSTVSVLDQYLLSSSHTSAADSRTRSLDNVWTCIDVRVRVSEAWLKSPRPQGSGPWGACDCVIQRCVTTCGNVGLCAAEHVTDSITGHGTECGRG